MLHSWHKEWPLYKCNSIGNTDEWSPGDTAEWSLYSIIPSMLRVNSHQQIKRELSISAYKNAKAGDSIVA